MHHAIIPARNGSKSIINKNLQRLTAKSLVELAIGQALTARFFDTIILTTDIPVLLDFYSDTKSIELHKRKREHASDTSRIADTVEEIILEYKIGEQDYIWLIQPTSPFRNRQDFVDIKDAVEATHAGSAISVKRSVSEHPSKQGTVTFRLGHYFFNPIHDFFSFENKEEMKPMYIRNGCFYVFKCGAFLKERTFIIKPCLAYAMSAWRSTNIDSQLELEIARGLARMHNY